MIAMYLAVMAKVRLEGVCLNDIGPVIETEGLNGIADYVGRPLTQSTQAELARDLPGMSPGFRKVPQSRWLEEAKRRSIRREGRLDLTYDPELRQRLQLPAASTPADFWPAFDALDRLPLALIRGENSNILSGKTAALMREKRPDMVFANVPDRGHVPYLDEPTSLAAIQKWLKKCA